MTSCHVTLNNIRGMTKKMLSYIECVIELKEMNTIGITLFFFLSYFECAIELKERNTKGITGKKNCLISNVGLN